MSTTSNDIPSLILRVLENIRGEIVGMRGEIVGMRGEIVGMRDEIVGMRGEVHGLNDPFDHFLGFVGRDLQDLKVRVAALERHQLGREP
ncbi:MAG: hypothetical protein H0T89_19200 [Deltaproteobacteria bacterium]|nr:hypothetical protein [Deltaproteobacteria bacterium]